MTIRSERGQSTAMVVTLLWVLVFFVAVVANVGQAVNRRIALQMVADAGAYTGGSVMATGLNHLAYWNRQIQRMFAWMSISSDGFSVNVCGCNPFVPFICDEWTVPLFEFAHGGYNIANVRIGLKLQEEPKRVSEYNLADLFPGESVSSFDMGSRDMSQETGMILNPYLTGDTPLLIAPFPIDNGTSPELGTPLWSNETFLDWIPSAPFSLGSSASTKSWTSICFPDSWDTTVQGFWYKLPRFGPAYYFVWRVKAPATKAIMFDSIIGPNAIPEMKAVGVTKPVGDRNRRGSIAKGDIGYKVKVVPSSKAMLFAGFIRDQLYKGFGGIRYVTH